MSRRSLDNATSADSLMRDNTKQISEGSSAVVRMGGAMAEINDSSEKISHIIKTIEYYFAHTNAQPV